MDSFGIQEMLVIAVVALVVFGPERLPELARQGAKWLNRFRSGATASIDELKRAANLEDLEEELASLREDVERARDSVTRPLKDAVAADGPRSANQAPPIDPDAT